MKRSRAWETAGYRERYAMEHGRKSVHRDNRGHTLITYRYSKFTEYQDANGAVYDATEGRWVN